MKGRLIQFPASACVTCRTHYTLPVPAPLIGVTDEVVRYQSRREPAKVLHVILHVQCYANLVLSVADLLMSIKQNENITSLISTWQPLAEWFDF